LTSFFSFFCQGKISSRNKKSSILQSSHTHTHTHTHTRQYCRFPST
jgi:hypothetical protein